jgi:hypothetical protein
VGVEEEVYDFQRHTILDALWKGTMMNISICIGLPDVKIVGSFVG